MYCLFHACGGGGWGVFMHVVVVVGRCSASHMWGQDALHTYAAHSYSTQSQRTARTLCTTCRSYICREARGLFWVWFGFGFGLVWVRFGGPAVAPIPGVLWMVLAGSNLLASGSPMHAWYSPYMLGIIPTQGPLGKRIKKKEGTCRKRPVVRPVVDS